MNILILFLLFSDYVYGDLECDILPNNTLYYYVLYPSLEVNDKRCYLSCNTKIVRKYSTKWLSLIITIKPALELHGVTMWCIVTRYSDGTEYFNRTYTLIAYNFTAQFTPKNTLLNFEDDNTVECIPQPRGKGIDYSATKFISNIVTYVVKVSQFKIKFERSSDLYYKTKCLECSCLNYFKKKICYTFTGNVVFQYNGKKVYLVYTQERMIKANYYAYYDKKYIKTICVLKLRNFTLFSISAGSLLLPTDLDSGNYTLYCYISHLRFINITKYFYVFNKKPLYIKPKLDNLNYSYQSIIECILKPFMAKYEGDLYFKPTNLSSSKFTRINKTVISINQLGDLNSKTFCFVCSIPLFQEIKCYKFIGYYYLVILPKSSIIYYMLGTEFSCKFYLRGIFKNVANMVPRNVDKSEYTILPSKFIKFSYSITLHGRYICLDCSFSNIEHEECYTFFAFMRIIYKPFEEIFYVFYYNPIVIFSFQDTNTSLTYEANCTLIGIDSIKRVDGAFNMTNNIPSGNYSFVCLMTSYNYNDSTEIIVENTVLQASISPKGGILSYKDKGLITCDSTTKGLVKHLNLLIGKKDLKYVTKVNKRQIQIHWDFYLKNKNLYFSCIIKQKKLAETNYQLQINISFIFTPYRLIYFMKTFEHQIYARFYDDFTFINLTSNCEYPQDPALIPQIGLFITLRPIVPAGVYKIFCSPENIKLKESFAITIKNELSLMILPDITILSTYSNYTIICKSKTYKDLTNTGLEFKTTYPISNAYKKTSQISYILISRIDFHNTSICFKCNMDNVAEVYRCYKWQGTIKFHRFPIRDVYFIYMIDLIKTYYINTKQPSVNVIAECSTISGPGKIFQDSNFNIVTRNITIGLYYVMCKMRNINQYDFFTMKIETPAKSILKSNFYPDVFNASHTLLFPGEEITVSLFYADLFPYIVYGWVHYNITNMITKSESERFDKNKILLLNKKKLTVLKENTKYGNDYMIYCYYSFNYSILKAVTDYTIGYEPDNIDINSLFYIIYYDKINYVSNGFPTELIFYNVKLDNIVICKHTKLKVCKIPIVENFGITRLKVTSILEQLSYIKLPYWTVKIISIRAFKIFKWKNENKIIYYKNDIVTCEVNLTTPYSLNIIKLSGESTIKLTVSNKLILPDLIFGEYKLACILSLENINEEFLRVKIIQIHSNSTDICFLPFAPVIHMLVKCITSHFPIKGNYTMKLIDVENKINLITNNYNLLRIPINIAINRKYDIFCKYSFNGKETNISKQFLLKGEYLVPILNENSSCITSEKIPVEYGYAFKDNVLSYNYLYYLDNDETRNDKHCVLLVFIFFIILIPVIPMMIWLRNLSKTEEIRQLMEQNTYNLRRLKIRRMNDKFISIIKLISSERFSEETRTNET